MVFLCGGRLIKDYLSSHNIRKLQIGSGPRTANPGWLNTDLNPKSSRCVYLDATKPFPFGDETFDFVFTEHMIEHIPYESGLRALSECYRVLKPGGKIRIITPSLEAMVGLLSEHLTETQQNFIKWSVDNRLPKLGSYNPVFVINNMMRAWGHEFIYDRVTLKTALEQTGFVYLRLLDPFETDEDQFKGRKCMVSKSTVRSWHNMRHLL